MKRYFQNLFLLVGLLLVWPVLAEEQNVNPVL